jgi:PhnB protein
MMHLTTHLNFNGECEAAFQFYAQRLGGKIVTLMRYEGSPMEKHVPAEWAKKVIHASMSLGDGMVMGADSMPGRHEAPKGFTVTLGMGDEAEAERIFAALSENGKIDMPLQKTFWATRFGMVTDRFGIPWMINCGSAES